MSTENTITAALTDDQGERRVLTFCAGLVLLLASLLALQIGSRADPGGVWWGLAILVGILYVAGEYFEAEIELRRESHNFAFTSVPLVLGLLFLPVPILVVVRVLASATVLVFVHRQDPLKLVVNLASHALEVVAAGLVFHAIGVPDSLGPRAWLAAALAVAVADLLGALVVTTAISLFEGAWESSQLVSIWVPMVVAVVDVSLALTVASGLRNDSPEVWLAVPIAVFVVGLTRAYARVVARHHAMERLDRFARDLGAAVVAGDVERSLLPHIADVLHAETAWVWSPEAPDAPKLAYRTTDGRVALDPPSRFDHVLSASDQEGVRRFGPNDQLLPEMAECGISEALVECLEVGDGRRVFVGVADRSGATRGFDAEDARLFSTLCSHAAVSLRNVGLVDRLRTESAGNEFLATHDPLTGLANRTLFLRRLEEMLGARDPVAVLLMDLDRFKEVNDTLGHASGDALLVEMGRRLGPSLSDDELLARLGGDEFALLVSAASGTAAAQRAAEVLTQVRRPFTVAGIAVDVDASIGVAVPGDHPVDASGLLRRADVAMYAAKADHGGVAVYAADLDHYSPKRLAVVGRLRQAIEDDELVLHYQPQVELATGRVIGVEALVRWHQPGRGDVPPGEFIPVAERTDLIHPLTRRVLAMAIADAATWHRDGRPLRVSVNLSARNLVEDDLVESVGAMLDEHGLPASALEIELTETTLMANPARAAAVMARLRDLGARIAIDDFGTGHSSLSYLTTLAVDTLKIDQSFIASMTVDRTAETIVSAIIDLAGNLALDVVAEGVETAASARALARMTCGSAQGFLFSRPIPGANLQSWLLDHDLERLHEGAPDGGSLLGIGLER